MREEEGGGERSEQRETRALTPPQFKDMKKRDCVVTLKIATLFHCRRYSFSPPSAFSCAFL